MSSACQSNSAKLEFASTPTLDSTNKQTQPALARSKRTLPRLQIRKAITLCEHGRDCGCISHSFRQLL
eukprot:6329797-Amphidinium_carterae.1